MEKTKPARKPQTEAQHAARQAREAAALRDNLLRRKQQQRDREKPKLKPCP